MLRCMGDMRMASVAFLGHNKHGNIYSGSAPASATTGPEAAAYGWPVHAMQLSQS